jgi:UDP-N-acetylmuramoyl-L-alanyl-D-glutamate--2,6-diaminopimelate ligase
LFGCGGNRDKEKRAIMGETAAKKCDFSILTSDNPRYEDPVDVIGAIEKGHRRFSIR